MHAEAASAFRHTVRRRHAAGRQRHVLSDNRRPSKFPKTRAHRTIRGASVSSPQPSIGLDACILVRRRFHRTADTMPTTGVRSPFSPVPRSYPCFRRLATRSRSRGERFVIGVMRELVVDRRGELVLDLGGRSLFAPHLVPHLLDLLFSSLKALFLRMSEVLERVLRQDDVAIGCARRLALRPRRLREPICNAGRT